MYRIIPYIYRIIVYTVSEQEEEVSSTQEIYMKITENTSVTHFPDVKIIKYLHFNDNRGYFTEHCRVSNMITFSNFNLNIKQCNQSFSKKNVCRGMHFQWSNNMGKMVRVVSGSIIDIFLDIRKDSPTYGYMGAHKLTTDNTYGQWIYVPEGFAHGCIFLEDSIIEYFCTAEYSGSTNEACIKMFDPKIKWDYIDKDICDMIESIKSEIIMSERDQNGFTLDDWTKNNINTFKTEN
jgi:dTDP-4-dehydrorhamnose 3,5-epimerase